MSLSRRDDPAVPDDIPEHGVGDHPHHQRQPPHRNILQLHHVHGGQQRRHHHHDPQLPPPQAGYTPHAGLGQSWGKISRLDSVKISAGAPDLPELAAVAAVHVAAPPPALSQDAAHEEEAEGGRRAQVDTI